MAAFITGFRETLEAAVLITVLLVAVRRLGHAHLAQLAWYGLGTGLMFGVSVATGLAAVNAGLEGQALVTLQLVSIGLALLATTALALWMRRRGAQAAVCADDATEAPGAWLMVAASFLAGLPQTLELAVRLAGLAPQVGPASLALAVAGLLAAVALAGVLYVGLMRCNPGRFFRLAPRRELAPVAQEAAERG
jgi:FTR1 family protein